MMKALYLVCAALLFSTLANSQQTTISKSFPVSPMDPSLPDEVRSYTVALPSGYSPGTPAPLIIGLHGYTSTIPGYRASLTMDSIAEANHVIMVYPKGDTCHWSYKPLSFLPDAQVGWNAGIITGDFDDVAFIVQVLDSVINDYNIDTNRIYCMGISNGGFLAMRVAAAMGDRITAAATIIGYDTLPPTTNVPIMTILGTLDPIVNLDGIPGVYPDWATVRSNWLGINGCGSDFVSDTLPDLDPEDNCWVEKRIYSTCHYRGTLAEYLIHDGGHTVPMTDPCASPPAVCAALGYKNYDIDPSVEIWNFFNSQIALSTPAKEELPVIRVYPNPFSHEVHFEWPAQAGTFHLRIHSIQGELVYEEHAENQPGRITWRPDHHPPGLYIYQISNQNLIRTGKIQLLH